MAFIFLVRVFRIILILSVRMMLTMSKIFARITCQTIEWEVNYSTAKKTCYFGFYFLIIFSSVGSSSYRQTIRLKQENFSCNNKTNYTRRHKFVTHKNNCCQVFSRSRNDQPLFVNEYKVKVGWQSFSLKNKFSGFRRAKHKHLLSKSKPYSTTSYEHVSILTSGGL